MNHRFNKTEAIVLNSIQFGEGHKIINLFTKSFGKLEASAFGSRKTKSRFGSKLEPFTISQFLLYHKDEDSPYAIKEADVRFQDTSISADYQKYSVAHALIEPVILFVEKGQVENNLYNLLSDALKVLSKIPVIKSMYLLSMYDIKFITIMGYTPDVSLCKKCGCQVSNAFVYMDQYYGFPICGRCKSGTSIHVVSGTLRFIHWANESPITLSEKVTMEKKTLLNIRSIIEHLYLHTFHKKPQSWKQLVSFY